MEFGVALTKFIHQEILIIMQNFFFYVRIGRHVQGEKVEKHVNSSIGKSLNLYWYVSNVCLNHKYICVHAHTHLHTHSCREIICFTKTIKLSSFFKGHICQSMCISMPKLTMFLMQTLLEGLFGIDKSDSANAVKWVSNWEPTPWRLQFLFNEIKKLSFQLDDVFCHVLRSGEFFGRQYS